MSSLAAEQRDLRARDVAVTEESLTVDLVDGRTIIGVGSGLYSCGSAACARYLESYLDRAGLRMGRDLSLKPLEQSDRALTGNAAI